MEKAYQGIETVVFVPPPLGPIDRCFAIDNSVNAAVKSGIKRFVLASFPTGSADSVNLLSPGFLFSEALVRTSQLQSWVIIRMGIWADNFLESFKNAALTGTLTQVAEPTDRIPLISREDTARGIAAVILDKKAIGRVYDIENNIAVSWREIAEYISQASGKRVTFKTISIKEYTQKIAAGLPEAKKSLAPMFAGIFASLVEMAAKEEITVTNDYFEVIGHHPESIRKYLKRVLPTLSA